jgi:hypothetical protein
MSVSSDAAAPMAQGIAPDSLSSSVKPSALRLVLAKDLRLSLDALLPILLIIGGFLLVGSLIHALPDRLLPDAFRLFGLSDFLASVSMVLGLLSPFLAGWCTAAVMLGDGRHRGLRLAASLPVPRRTARLARFLALLPGLLLPAVLCVLLFALARLLDPSIVFKGTTELPWWMPLTLSAVGTLAVWCAARTGERSMFAVQLIGHLTTLALVVGGYGIAWATIPLTLPELGRVAVLLDAPEAIRVAADIRGMLSMISMLAAATTFGLFLWASYWFGASRRWPRRAMRNALIASAGCAALVATATPTVAIHGISIPPYFPWEQRDLIEKPDAEIADGIASTMEFVRANPGRGVPNEIHRRWVEGLRRVRQQAENTGHRVDHPLVAVFLANESYEHVHAASWSVSWYALGDPRQEIALLKAIRAHPTFVEMPLTKSWLMMQMADPNMGPMMHPYLHELNGHAQRDIIAWVDLQRVLLALRPDMPAEERVLREEVRDRLLEAYPDLVFPPAFEERYQRALRGQLLR